MSMLSWSEFVLRLGAAVLGGALIGFERQWRSRGAGLRTNTLVAAGAAMFVLISHMAPPGDEPDAGHRLCSQWCRVPRRRRDHL